MTGVTKFSEDSLTCMYLHCQSVVMRVIKCDIDIASSRFKTMKVCFNMCLVVNRIEYIRKNKTNRIRDPATSDPVLSASYEQIAGT